MTADNRHHHEPEPERPTADTSTGSATSEWLLVGAIVGPFGVRGEVKVRPETDFPDRFARTPVLYLGSDHIPYPVAGARLVAPHVLLRLRGVADMNAAERLRGAEVFVPAAQAMPLAPDQYYIHDLIGLRVERPDGTPLGTVANVYTGGAQDVYVVRAVDSGREVLVPAVQEMVKRVDLSARVMVLDPVAGLFDERFETAE